MSKFLNLLEMNKPTDGFKDPNDAVVNSIKKLCDALKIPYEVAADGLLILNKHDRKANEEEAEDFSADSAAKTTSALGALLSIPDQNTGFLGRNKTAKKINDAKQKIADGISSWADKWISSLR